MKKGCKDKSWIVYLSTYPPRECGIATFCKDLTTAMDKRFNPNLKSRILAINDNGSSIYNYGNKVMFQMDDSNVEDYIRLAKKINQSKKIKLVNVQHEFGIFDGRKYGEFLIPLLDNLTKPVVVTFHSILSNPDKHRIQVVQAIAKRSESIIVMAKTAIDILHDEYKIDPKKIHFIHHGVPTIPFKRNREKIKKSLGMGGKIVLTTFGLINRGKGIEYVIKALPKVVGKHPNLLYVIVGETHPQVRKNEGEEYRNKLIKLVKKLNLENNVKFYNKYLTLEEIITYLEASDIYIYSALDPNQIVSGTLAYAIGAGNAIIATPSVYAKEMLKNDRGIIVKFKDQNSMTKAIDKILSNTRFKRTLEKNAYELGRNMTWPNIALKYLEVFKKNIDISEGIEVHKLPKIKLDHLLNITDGTGVIQHAKHSVCDRSTGYTVDDNARALIAVIKYHNLFKSEQDLKLINTYLSFLYHAQRDDGYIHNLMSYDKKFLDKKGSEDSYGRTLLATGCVVSSKVNENLKSTAKFIFDKAVKHAKKLKDIRPQAFSICGLYEYYKVYKHKDILDKIKYLTDKLIKKYEMMSTNDWKWFEESITYTNGKIPEALFLAYDITKNKKYLKVAEESLNFLSNLLILNNKLVLIGHNGWYNYGGKREFYDQQPVDASSMVQVYTTAYNITGNKEYHDKAILSYNWFLGRNSINQVVYDENTGGCFDGLLPDCVNLNQGAESTICHLIARLDLEE